MSTEESCGKMLIEPCGTSLLEDSVQRPELNPQPAPLGFFQIKHTYP